jgi:hypothetical protein
MSEPYPSRLEPETLDSVAVFRPPPPPRPSPTLRLLLWGFFLFLAFLGLGYRLYRSRSGRPLAIRRWESAAACG